MLILLFFQGVAKQSAARKQQQPSASQDALHAAEQQLDDMLQDRQVLDADQARLRLFQVLETYTDITRFPRYAFSL